MEFLLISGWRRGKNTKIVLNVNKNNEDQPNVD